MPSHHSLLVIDHTHSVSNMLKQSAGWVDMLTHTTLTIVLVVVLCTFSPSNAQTCKCYTRTSVCTRQAKVSHIWSEQVIFAEISRVEVGMFQPNNSAQPIDWTCCLCPLCPLCGRKDEDGANRFSLWRHTQLEESY